jgi:hypothetical protein
MPRRGWEQQQPEAHDAGTGASIQIRALSQYYLKEHESKKTTGTSTDTPLYPREKESHLLIKDKGQNVI